ncbi:uncharacterized protein [Lepisosteus oculatus]|uniref:uncharacterized protein n=1 Tax=Lepisosteus oculatus TaxID=7918 RepID=UPI00371C51ED
METEAFYGKRRGASAAPASKERRPVLQKNTARAKRSTTRTVKKKVAVGLCSRPLARVPTCRSSTCVETFRQQREQYDALLGRIGRLETLLKMQRKETVCSSSQTVEQLSPEKCLSPPRRLQCLAEALPPAEHTPPQDTPSRPLSSPPRRNLLMLSPPSVSPQEAQRNSQTPVRRIILPDVQLLPITQEMEGGLYLQCICIDGKARADRYAALVFRNLVTFEIYWGWTTSVNFDGSRGKSALPCNLRETISTMVNRRFSTLIAYDWKIIRDRINEMLRRRRRSFPLV